MNGIRRFNVYAAALGLTCAAGVTLLRIALVEGLEMWTPDGRLAVDPWIFSALNGAHIGLTLAIVIAMLWPTHREG